MLRLFVGNIPHSCGDTELKAWFEQQGHSVTFSQVIRDRLTGHSRGFGFVELSDTSDLRSAVERLNGQRLAPMRARQRALAEKLRALLARTVVAPS